MPNQVKLARVEKDLTQAELAEQVESPARQSD